MGEISDWHVDQLTGLKNRIITPDNQIDTRSILHRFDDNSLKKVAKEMFDSGISPDPKFLNLTVNLINTPGPFTGKQKNALITFIMYGK